jgi:hypothetical protein
MQIQKVAAIYFNFIGILNGYGCRRRGLGFKVIEHYLKLWNKLQKSMKRFPYFQE